MASGFIWTLVIVGIIILGLLVYWQLIVAEGAYLGQHIVTWLYDLTANRYDKIKGFDPDMEAAFLGRPLVIAMRYITAPFVLDIATGTGRLPIALLEQPSFHGRIVGVDDSRKMLSIAVNKTRDYADRIDLIWRDAAHLPFPNNAFDMVTCLEMVEFTPNPEGQLAEAVRVLRPRGILVTTRRRGYDARLMPGKTHSREEFVELLKDLGLMEIQIIPWQVDYDLVWGVLEGNATRGARSLLEALNCPQCSTIAFREQNDALRCDHCGAIYTVRNSVIELHE